MLEPLSLSLCLGFTTMSAYARSSSAVSPEAQSLAQSSEALRQRQERSQALFGRKALAISQLHFAMQEAMEPCATDSGEVAPTLAAISRAESFLRALPDDVPLPEFAVEPDGAISLDWIHSRTRMLSVSVTERERVAYAWLDGSDHGRAVVSFRNEVIHPQILNLIRSTVADGAPSLRAA